MTRNRLQLRQKFLQSCDLNSTRIELLPQDASFRRYFRIHDQSETFILMDAPPEHEDIKPFIDIAQHLLALNLKAPKIYQHDIKGGFILLEDFGANTFTQLLDQDYDEESLYKLAVGSLIKLQTHQQATDIKLPAYSVELLINEALLLCDWYYPGQTGEELSLDNRLNYIDCWNTIFASLPRLESTLVLRDFHVDNLIRLSDGSCGLLDFQDAVIGSPAYDLVSLLEDARRDISQSLQEHMFDHYFSNSKIVNQNDFMRWYNVLGAQRHCKVLGIFTRLSTRDNKHHYLVHIDRIQRLLNSHLDQRDLVPLKNWLIENSLSVLSISSGGK